MADFNKEFLNGDLTALELMEQAFRNKKTAALNSMNLTTDLDNSDVDIVDQEQHQITLTNGSHNGLIIDHSNTTVLGIGDVILKPTIINEGTSNEREMSLHALADSKFSNIRFPGDVTVGTQENLAAASVTAIFHNCTFTGTVYCQGSAHFIGCLFLPTAVLIRLAGNPVYVMGCSNKGTFSGIPLVNQFGVTT